MPSLATTSSGRIDSPTRVRVTTDLTPDRVESQIETLLKSDLSGTAEILLSRNLSSHFLSDTWVSILLGTAARNFANLRVIDWWNYQQERAKYTDYIYSSVAAVTAITFASEFLSLDKRPLPITRKEVVDSISGRHLPLLGLYPEPSDHSPGPIGSRIRGMLNRARGESNTICEFDPSYNLADIFSGGRYPIFAREFQSLFRRAIGIFRRDLEFGAANKGVLPVDAGDLGQLTTFLMELHENSYDYGRFGRPDPTGNRLGLDGVRFVRLRKHVGTKPDLVRRASSLPPLAQYLDKALTGPSVLIEAGVSDFGLGIPEFLRTSAARDRYGRLSSRDLLDQVFDGLATSRTMDQGAGSGIYKALRATRQISGFVSLRTEDSWKQRGFHSDDTDTSFRLNDMLPDRALAEIAGTHWHFIYHQVLR